MTQHLHELPTSVHINIVRAGVIIPSSINGALNSYSPSKRAFYLHCQAFIEFNWHCLAGICLSTWAVIDANRLRQINVHVDDAGSAESACAVLFPLSIPALDLVITMEPLAFVASVDTPR